MTSVSKFEQPKVPSSMTLEGFRTKQHKFLNASKDSDFTLASRLMQECPKLINGQPSGRDGRKRWTALFQAIYTGNLDAVRFFLLLGANAQLKTDRDDQEPMTPMELAAKLKGDEEELPEYLLGNGWSTITEEREEMYQEIEKLLETNAMLPRENAIAHSYIVAMSDGNLGEDAVQELINQWLLLDPTMSLIDDVADRINGHYDEVMSNFVEKLDFPMLRKMLEWLLLWPAFKTLIESMPLRDTNNPTFGDLLCWKFEIDAQDVRHALDDLNPPKDVCDADVLWQYAKHGFTFMIPLWGQGSTRAAFQFLAFKRFCQSFASPGEQQPDRRPAFRRSKTMPIEAAERHAFDMFTLYATVFMCTAVAYLTDIYSVYGFFMTVCTILNPEHGFRAKLVAVLWQLLLVWLAGVARAYNEAMQPRIPMLTVRLHKKMQQRGRLTEKDYTVCEKFKPYEEFGKSQEHSD